jgi:hypothetical protein
MIANLVSFTSVYFSDFSPLGDHPAAGSIRALGKTIIQMSASAKLLRRSQGVNRGDYEPAASEGGSIAVNAASDIEMGFVIHVELPPMTIDRLSNFIEQLVALRGLHHPVVRLRA